jgi:hypothetical protein
MSDQEAICHYGMACEVENYTGVAQWRDNSVLVLNDEPYQTAIYEDELGLMLVRWMYAPDEASVVQSLRAVRDHLKLPVETVELSVKEATQFLMDAAADGARTNDVLEVKLKPGRFLISTHVYRPTDELALLIHIFHLLDE